MHDAILCETQGIPAFCVISNVFEDLAALTARRLGASEFVPLVVPHPVFTRTADWIGTQALALGEAIERRVVGDLPS